MPENQVGIVQLQRCIAGLQVALPRLVLQLKDGMSISDISALMGDATFMQALDNIKSSAASLKAETTDLTLDEGIQLLGPVAGLIAAIVKAVKSQPGA